MSTLRWSADSALCLGKWKKGLSCPMLLYTSNDPCQRSTVKISRHIWLFLQRLPIFQGLCKTTLLYRKLGEFWYQELKGSDAVINQLRSGEAKGIVFRGILIRLVSKQTYITLEVEKHTWMAWNGILKVKARHFCGTAVISGCPHVRDLALYCPGSRQNILISPCTLHCPLQPRCCYTDLRVSFGGY